MVFQSASPSSLSVAQAALVLAPSILALAVAFFAGTKSSITAAWRRARWASTAALTCAALSLAAVLSGLDGIGFGVRADAPGSVVLLVVAFIGWVIVRYSEPYLDGELQERYYIRWLMATLAAVSVVVATNHVLVLALAWMATSLALHRLLTFVGDRPAAMVVAHKKFIIGRAADACMLGAAALLAVAFGTLNIDEIMVRAAALPQLPQTAKAAVLLVSLAALLKCAQLPFHGWLIQVMEAPTPVSALLHAGVVNLGGFVLICFAPLVSEVPVAQALLVAAGAATAVLAALVMSTRISIKVMLAWSTCAQMGFMLMQCGIGAWEMALLHLVAHSLYKAHAFLSAGGAVRRTSLAHLTPHTAEAGVLALASGVVIGMALTLLAGVTWSLLGLQTTSPAIWVLAGVVAVSLVPLVNPQTWGRSSWWLPSLALGAYGVAFCYFALHGVFGNVVPRYPTTPPTALWVAVALAFGGLFIVQSLIAIFPRGIVARRLYPWFYGGLFLDEAFSRIVFRLWSPPPPAAAAARWPRVDATIVTIGAHA